MHETFGAQYVKYLLLGFHTVILTGPVFRPLAVCLGAFDFPPLVLRLDEHVVAAIYAEPANSELR